MRVLIAGAAGAIGRPLVRCLIEHGHAVFALARSPQSAREVAESGTEPVTADALDAASVKAAVRRVRPNAVINELTSLPRHYTAAEMEAAADRDRKVRIEGNANLLAAVRDVACPERLQSARITGAIQIRADFIWDSAIRVTVRRLKCIRSGARRRVAYPQGDSSSSRKSA